MSASRRFRRQIAQHRALHLLPSIPDDAPEVVKNGLAIRNQASASGTCPGCGATVELSGPIRPGTITHAVFRHDDECPALLEGLR